MNYYTQIQVGPPGARSPYRLARGERERVLVVTATSVSLWTAARRDLAMFFSYIDGVEIVLRGSAFIGLTGGPAADFNMALFGEDPDDLAVFDDFVSRVNATGVSALALLSSAASQRLGPVAKAKGLIQAGTAPLMARSGALPETPTSEFVIQRVTEAREMSIFGDLAASAFGMDRAWVDRTFATASLLDAPAMAFYIAYRGDVPLSAVCSSGAGSTVGIWTMSTPPDKQRQGAGRAVLLAAMQDHIKRRAETFYLIATAAGKPLYDNLGFKIIDELPIWLVGGSSPFPAH
jgi:GNAT superfamily N-acetyltransferase